MFFPTILFKTYNRKFTQITQKCAYFDFKNAQINVYCAFVIKTNTFK